MSVHFRNKLYKNKIPHKIRLYQLRYFLLSFSGNLPEFFKKIFCFALIAAVNNNELSVIGFNYKAVADCINVVKSGRLRGYA